MDKLVIMSSSNPCAAHSLCSRVWNNAVCEKIGRGGEYMRRRGIK